MTDHLDREAIAGRINTVCLSHHTSAVALARAIGAHPKTIGAWRSGRSVPTLEMLYEFSGETCEPMCWFVSGDDGSYSEPTWTKFRRALIRRIKGRAKALDVPPLILTYPRVREFLSGGKNDISVNTLVGIAAALGCSVAELTGEA